MNSVVPTSVSASGILCQASLSRPFTGAAPTVSIVSAGRIYGERIYQTDIRFSRTIRTGQPTVRPTVSVYNFFNSNAVQTYNEHLRAGMAGAADDHAVAIRRHRRPGGFLERRSLPRRLVLVLPVSQTDLREVTYHAQTSRRSSISSARRVTRTPINDGSNPQRSVVRGRRAVQPARLREGEVARNEIAKATATRAMPPWLPEPDRIASQRAPTERRADRADSAMGGVGRARRRDDATSNPSRPGQTDGSSALPIWS